MMRDNRFSAAHRILRTDLLDSIPNILNLLIESLEQPDRQTLAPGRLEGVPLALVQRYAQERFGHGYSLRESLLELTLLRTVIFELLQEQDIQLMAAVAARIDASLDETMVVAAAELGSRLALHRLEEKHRLERELLRSILEQIGVGILMADVRGAVRFMNREAEVQLGGPFKEVPPDGWLEAYPLFKSDGTPFALEETPLYRALQGHGVSGEELDVIRPDGSVRILWGTATPLRDRDGSSAGAVLAFRDETEQRRKLRDLKVSEERLRRLLEGVRDYAIFMLDPEGRVLSWNTGAERITGYSAAEIIGQSIAVLRTPEDRQSGTVERDLKKAEASDWVELESQYVRKDQSRFWARSVVTPLRDPRGRLQGFSKVICDVTERKRAEEALKRSEARFRRLVESNIIGTLVGDQAGKIRDANDAFLSMVGRTREELTRGCLDWVDMTPPEYLPAHERALEEINSRGTCTPYEVEFIRKDGTRVPVLIGAASLGGTQGEFTCFALDLTERKQIERERDRLLALEQAARTEAEKAQQRMAFLADASVQLSATLDYRATLQTLARLAVPRLADWCVIRVYTRDGRLELAAVAHPDPVIEARGLEIIRQCPEDPLIPAAIAAALRTGQTQLLSDIDEAALGRFARSAEDLELLRALGPRAAMAVPLTAGGRNLGVISFMAEKGRTFRPEDRATAEDLARRAAMAVDNARLYDEAQDAVRARDEFLAIASHELKTPLFAMDLEVQLFQRRYAQDSPLLTADRLARTMDNLGRQCKRLNGLVNNLLDISRLVGGQLKLELSQVDLTQVVHDITQRLSDSLEEAGCPVHLQLQPGVVGHWDWTRLEQVVTNLLTNAMKYGRGQAIEISLEVGDRNGEAWATLQVQDHGTGIALPDQARIFERFQRASTSHEKSSLGLGLYISHQIVRAHGGSIRVQSEPGQGALFITELPLSGPPQPPGGPL